MCRLALMNRNACLYLGPQLPFFYKFLQEALGGDGNGVAGLWQDTGRTRVQKGIRFTADQAAAWSTKFSQQGADWLLFHTRRATSSAIANQHCHPFRSGALVLAHNGHDSTFARLSRFASLSDSECITQTWGRVQFPLTALAERRGVFIGFHHDHPFVVKGQMTTDLVAAWHQQTGAVLFASALPSWMQEGVFDKIVQVGTIQWFGRELDQSTLNIRPSRSYEYATRPWRSDTFWENRYLDAPGGRMDIADFLDEEEEYFLEQEELSRLGDPLARIDALLEEGLETEAAENRWQWGRQINQDVPRG